MSWTVNSDNLETWWKNIYFHTEREALEFCTAHGIFCVHSYNEQRPSEIKQWVTTFIGSHKSVNAACQHHFAGMSDDELRSLYQKIRENRKFERLSDFTIEKSSFKPNVPPVHIPLVNTHIRMKFKLSYTKSKSTSPDIKEYLRTRWVDMSEDLFQLLFETYNVKLAKKELNETYLIITIAVVGLVDIDKMEYHIKDSSTIANDSIYEGSPGESWVVSDNGHGEKVLMNFNLNRVTIL